ncbi:MAG: O-antigen ligase family protein [Bacteroidales bacterium]|nr:O-antigen ligase family protein [Bacteroidales bacterium]
MNLSQREKYVLWGSIGAFILINLFCIWKEFLFFPIVSFIVLVLYLLIYRVDLLMYFMAFVTPLSITINDERFSIGLSLPSEFIMVSLTLLFLCRILYDLRLDPRLVKHPISIVIYIYLTWMLLTSITSELPVVSFKFLAAKLWFITSSYFMVLQLIKDDLKNAVKFFNCYTVGLCIVVIYTTIRHSLWGFSEWSGHWVMSPFYNDHTAYGAILAFFIPIVTAFLFSTDKRKNRWFYGIALALLLMGLYLSFCRAAWLSIMAVIGVWMVMKLRIKFSWLVMAALVLGSLFYFYSDDILYKMGRNSQDTSGNLVEHLQSMSNISTDASNVERLNRWTSAFRMIEERPVLGWGPGTYQFVYAPFQRYKYHTIITTDFGDGGNAHSEYLGPCSESGIMGLLTVLALAMVVLYCGIRSYSSCHDPASKRLVFAMTLALVSYFIHGFLNNFLDTDKLSLPFWAAIAVIAIIDAQQKELHQQPMVIHEKIN